MFLLFNRLLKLSHYQYKTLIFLIMFYYMNFLLLCNYTFKEINKTKHIKQITEKTISLSFNFYNFLNLLPCFIVSCNETSTFSIRNVIVHRSFVGKCLKN